MSAPNLSSSRLGVLSVRLLYARGLKDGDLIGQQDPYVKAHVGTQVLRSRVVRGGGVNPTFNQTLLFHVTDRTMTLVLELLDQDVFKDDHLGVATTDLTELIAAGLPPAPPPSTAAADDKAKLQVAEAQPPLRQPEPQLLTLPVRSRKSGKQRGTITLELTFTPRGIEPPGAPERASSLPEPTKLPSAPPAVGYPAVAVATGTPAAARRAPAGHPSSSSAAPRHGAQHASYYGAQQHGRSAYGQLHPQQQVVYVHQQPYRGRYGGYGGYGGYGYGGGVGLGAFGGLLGGLLLADLAFGC